jgi:hypothetical protein
MKLRRKSSRSAIRFPEAAIECLEQRLLLTGNVSAAVLAGGNLLVLGDSKPNQIAIQSTSGGGLQISSLDGTTKINGSTSPFTANGVTGNVYIFLGQGNDVLQIGDGTTAAVTPAVVPLTTMIPQNLLVVTGNGNDMVHIADTSIGGNCAIIGGIGSDTITVGSASTDTAVSVGGCLLIDGGFGNSTIAVFDANVTSDLTILGNGSNDHIQVGYDEGLGIIGNESDTGHVNVGGDLSITDVGSGFGFGNEFACLGGLLAIADTSDPGSCGFSRCFALANSCGPGFAGLFCAFNCGLGCSGGGKNSGEHVAVADVDVTGNLSIQTG